MSRNIRPVENFIVAKPSQAFYNTSGAGDNITDPSTSAVRLADGQIGIFVANDKGSRAPHSATAVNPTIAQAPSIYIAQGTEYSANPGQFPGAVAPLWNRPYERTADIHSSTKVTIRKEVYARESESVWVIGAPDTAAGEITVADNTEYQISIVYRGTRHDEMFNYQASRKYAPSVVTPDYTTLATAEPRDHMLQNLVYNINRNSATSRLRNRFGSNELVVAFAIDSTGAAGQDIGGGAPIAAGDVIPVVNTSAGIQAITLTEAQAESIKAAAVAATGTAIAGVTWSILAVDLATAGTVTGGVADLFMVMGLDSRLAYNDRTTNQKTRLDIALPLGFSPTVNKEQESNVSLGSGNGRRWNQLYKNSQGQRKYNLNHRQIPVIEFPSPIDEAATYTSYVISHLYENQVDTANTLYSPHASYILVPSAETTLVTALDTAFNAWLASAGYPNVNS